MTTRNLPLLVPRPPTDPIRVVWATVTAASPLRVKIDGETTALPFTPDSLVSNLIINDRVLVMLLSNPSPKTKSRRVIILGRTGFDSAAAVNSAIAAALTHVTGSVDFSPSSGNDFTINSVSVGRGFLMAVSGSPAVTSGNALTTPAAESSTFTSWTSGTNSMVWRQRIYEVIATVSISNNLAGASTTYAFSKWSVNVRSTHGALTVVGATSDTSVQTGHLDDDKTWTFFVKNNTGTDITAGLGMSIVKGVSSIGSNVTIDSASIAVRDVADLSNPLSVLCTVMS
jgi:hypothetical protein